MPRFLFALCCLFTSLPAAEVFTAPITLSSYPLPYVTVKINGREALASLDTGGYRSIQISGRLAKELGLELSAEAAGGGQRHQGGPMTFHAVKLARFELGRFALTDTEALVAEGDIERIEQMVKTPFDVIIGWGLLSQFHVAVDYPQKELRWSREPFAKLPAGLTLSYADDKRTPIVSGKVDGREIKLLFDTGAPTCNLDVALAGEKEKINTLVERPLTLAGQTWPLGFRVKDLTNIKRSLGCDAVVGNNLLTRMRVYFDPAAKTIRLVESRP